MKNLKLKAHEYAKQMWGIYYDDNHPDSAVTETVGELSEKDFIAGFEYAQSILKQTAGE